MYYVIREARIPNLECKNLDSTIRNGTNPDRKNLEIAI